MNTIYGLLILQAGTIKDPVAIAALEDAGSRIQGMMLLYDKLYRAEAFMKISVADYLPSLIEEIVSNFPNRSYIFIEKEIDDFMLDVKKAQTLAIILNELLTNIMKYAFIGRNGGEIKISVSIKDDIITMVVADNGNGMPESVNFEKSEGFGLVLVGSLTSQLYGKIRIERKKGTRIVLEFKRGFLK